MRVGCVVFIALIACAVDFVQVGSWSNNGTANTVSVQVGYQWN